ncbi:MAG: hypothetical protein O2779_04310 [Nanoarchaeota archaeon]|nr:hypothetical protein [Nanoarchaeota archaeon]
MIARIKGLMQIKDDLDVLRKSVIDQEASVTSLSDGVLALGRQLAEVREQQNEFLVTLKADMGVISESKEDFKKEVYDFKLLKSQLQTKIMKKFEEELDKELQLQMDKVKHDAETYNKMNNQLAVLVTQTGSLGSELDKFRVISKSIKNEDFQLESYAKLLERGDKEKLELMRKIDTLERLCSKLRRDKR